MTDLEDPKYNRRELRREQRRHPLHRTIPNGTVDKQPCYFWPFFSASSGILVAIMILGFVALIIFLALVKVQS